MIPIVGPDMLEVTDGDGKQRLYTLLAQRLADYLGVPADDLPKGTELDAVACRYMDQGNSVEDVYPALKSIMADADEIVIPESLKQLASIRGFNLFISATFDPLLVRAINEVRFEGEPRTRVFSYAPSAVEDLPEDGPRAGSPIVFHLLGKLSAVPAYAVTEEDTLEFLHALQSETQQPKLLMDELSRANVLLLGSSFDGWLARFFLRATRRQRLSLIRGSTDYVADHVMQQDTNLVMFLKHFSTHTKIYSGGGAVEFVQELRERWRQANPDEVAAGAASAALSSAAADVGVGDGAVFLSYASEDRVAAEAIKGSLEASGVDVFFDKQELRAGDDFEAKLKRNIGSCSLFVPLISRHSATAARRFFRIEWARAMEEAVKVAPTERFILPIVIDDTKPTEEAVPEAFRRLHWDHFPGGQVTPEFVMMVRDIFRRYQKSLAGAQ